jgi:hypothetical protein
MDNEYKKLRQMFQDGLISKEDFIKKSHEILGTEDTIVIINKYKTLIDAYLAKKISVDEFSKKYVESFLGEKKHINEPEFIVLNDLFMFAEGYDSMWTEKDEEEFSYRVTEKTLHRVTQTQLDKLNKILEEQINNT